MDFSFFNRPVLKKITGGGIPALAEPARRAVEGILQQLPDLLMAYVADVATGNILAAYTSHRDYNPNQVSLRNARIFGRLADALAGKPWLGGPVQDLTVVLDDQLHHLRLCGGGKQYCFVAVLTAEANLGIVKTIVNQHAP